MVARPPAALSRGGLRDRATADLDHIHQIGGLVLARCPPIRALGTVTHGLSPPV